MIQKKPPMTQKNIKNAAYDMYVKRRKQRLKSNQIKAIIEASSVSDPHWAIYLNADPDLALQHTKIKFFTIFFFLFSIFSFLYFTS
jgi:hypothetical protein